MIDKKELLKKLCDNKILFIMVGDLALRMYRHPHVTHVIDLAVRTLDVDRIIEVMYTNDYYLVSEINNDAVILQLSAKEAVEWVEASKSGSMTFISIPKSGVHNSPQFPFNKIDTSTQIDFFFELGVPIMKMKKKAKTIFIDGYKFLLAAQEDLLILKENMKKY